MRVILLSALVASMVSAVAQTPPQPEPPPPHVSGQLFSLPSGGGWEISRSGQIYSDFTQDGGGLSVWSPAGGSAAVNLTLVPTDWTLSEVNAGLAIFAPSDLTNSLVSVNLATGVTESLNFSGTMISPHVAAGKVYFIGVGNLGGNAYVYEWQPGTSTPQAVSPAFAAPSNAPTLAISAAGDAFAMSGAYFSADGSQLNVFYSVATGPSGPSVTQGSDFLNPLLAQGAVSFNSGAAIKAWAPSLGTFALGTLPPSASVRAFRSGGIAELSVFEGSDYVEGWFADGEVVTPDQFFHDQFALFNVDATGLGQFTGGGIAADGNSIVVHGPGGVNYAVVAVPEPSTLGLLVFTIVSGVYFGVKRTRDVGSSL